MSNKITGLVEWFNSNKGFGSITPQDGNKNIFMYFFATQSSNFKTLDESQKMESSVENGAKSPSAVNAVVL